MRGRALLMLSVLCLAACQPQDTGQALQDDYLQRLARVLDSPLPSAQPLPRSDYRLPARRTRLLPIEEIRISLLELLVDIQPCPRLQQLLGERNGSLGRQLTASQRLGFDNELLQAMQDCQPHLQGAAAERLQGLYQQKRAQMPAVFWNALNASSEFEHLLRAARHSLPPGQPMDQQALAALQRLALIGQTPHAGPPRPVSDELFQALQRNHSLAQLLTSLLSLQQSLERGNGLLRARLQRPLCPGGYDNPRAQAVLRVFQRYYAGQLQPYLAEVEQQGQAWQQALQALRQTPGIPPALNEYLARLSATEHSLWQSFQASRQAHVEHWQALLRSCQMAPGQPRWRLR